MFFALFSSHLIILLLFFFAQCVPLKIRIYNRRVILIKKILSVVNSDMFVLVVTKFRMINAPPRATRDVGREIFQIAAISSYRYLSLGGYRDGDGFVLNVAARVL